MGPESTQHPLSRADGSTIFSDGLYSILAGVNGPVEVQRRDELPEEAAIEVNIRPSSGVGGPRERWQENVLQSVLRSILLVHMHPRTLVQVTLQMMREPAAEGLKRAVGDIAIMPALLNTTFLALVDAGLPLACTATAVLVGVDHRREVVLEPQGKNLKDFGSLHALSFNQYGELLMDESSGRFDLSIWESVEDAARRKCLAAMAVDAGDDTSMANGGAESASWLKETLYRRMEVANAWRADT